MDKLSMILDKKIKEARENIDKLAEKHKENIDKQIEEAKENIDKQIEECRKKQKRITFGVFVATFLTSFVTILLIKLLIQ